MNKILLIFTLFSMACPALAAKKKGRGYIRFLKGKVEIVGKKGKGRKAKEDMNFFEGETIKTGKRSFAILKFQDGSTIKMDPKTSITAVKLIRKKGRGLVNTSSLVLTVGGAMVEVVKKVAGPPSMEIKTKTNLSLGVRGTAFYLFIDAVTNNTWGTVKHGRVMAMDYNEDDSEYVSKGESVVFLRNKNLTKPLKYKWSEKINWNKKMSKSLETNMIGTRDLRLSEINKNYQNITNRRKKPFLKKLRGEQLRYKDKVKPVTETTIYDDSGNATKAYSGNVVIGDETSGGAKGGNPGGNTNTNPNTNDNLNVPSSGDSDVDEENAKDFCDNIKLSIACAVRTACTNNEFTVKVIGNWRVCASVPDL